MKLEYLEDISEGGKYKDVVSDNLIRLYSFDVSQIQSLKKSIQENIIEHKASVRLNDLEFIEALNCELKLIVSESNKGIVLIEQNRFECQMNMQSYEWIVSILKADLVGELGGFYWLNELSENETEIDFLLSLGGGW